LQIDPLNEVDLSSATENVRAIGQMTKVNPLGNAKGHLRTTVVPQLTNEDTLNVVLVPNFMNQGTLLTTEIANEIKNLDDPLVVTCADNQVVIRETTQINADHIVQICPLVLSVDN